MVVSKRATIDERTISATVRWAGAVAAQARKHILMNQTSWLVNSSRATLERRRPPICGGGGTPVEVSRLVIQARLVALIDGGVLPATAPARLFVGRCLEAHACTACDVDIYPEEPEFEWTNAGNQVLYFHRRCAEIYRTLKDEIEAG